MLMYVYIYTYIYTYNCIIIYRQVTVDAWLMRLLANQAAHAPRTYVLDQRCRTHSAPFTSVYDVLHCTQEPVGSEMCIYIYICIYSLCHYYFLIVSLLYCYVIAIVFILVELYDYGITILFYYDNIIT